jgi:hypothetical protein
MYGHWVIMSKADIKEYRELLQQASEMFNETGRVPGVDGEEGTDAKEYISETIHNPDAT